MAKFVFDEEQPKKLVFDEEEPSILKNAVTDVKDITKGMAALGDKAANVPLDFLDSINQIGRTDFNELPIVKDVGATADAIVEMPRALWNRGKEIVSDPVGSFKEKPVSTVLDVASVAVPALKAAKLSSLAKIAEGAAPSLEKLAINRGMKALGRTKGTLNTSADRKIAENTARSMLEEKVITPLATSDDMLARSKSIHLKALNDLDNFLSTRGGGIDSHVMIKKLNELRPKKADGTWLSGGMYEETNKAIDKAIDTVRSHGDKLTFKDANSLKTFFQKSTKTPYQGTAAESDIGKGIAAKTREAVDETLEERAKSVADPDMTFRSNYASPDEAVSQVKEFFKNKKLFGTTADAAESLDRKIGSEFGNKQFGLTDTIIAGGGVGAGALTEPVTAAGTVATILAKKVAEKYGNQILASGAWKGAKLLRSTADKVEKLAKSNPQALGKYAAPLQKATMGGAGGVAVADWVLQNNDPEYREMIRNLPKEEGEE